MDLKLVILVSLSLIQSTHGDDFGSCFTPDQYKGACVYLNECPYLLDIYNNRSEAFADRMYVSLSQCGLKDGQPLVCCNNLAQTASSSRLSSANGEENLINNDLFPRQGDCGVYEANKIDNGNRTLLNEHPWMALLEYKKPGGLMGFHCGGVLITKRYVLTASHCVNGLQMPSTWSLRNVRLGDWDTTSDNDCDFGVCNNPVNVAIEQIIDHENYNPQSSNQLNNIALLRLSIDVAFTSFIRPICLPSDPTIQSMNSVSRTFVVAGWGKTEKLLSFPIKMKSVVKGFSNRDCESAYDNRQIDDTQLCAGINDTVDRFGDSGGPLMAQSERVEPFWYVAGIALDTSKGWTGVYTKVDKFMSWIEANVKA